MANMAYVRFQNTLNALQDCNDHIFDEDLSPEEERAMRRLIALCREIAAEFDEDDEEEEE